MINEAGLGFAICSIKNETERVWISKELHNVYVEKGGTESHVYRFTNTVIDCMNDDLYCFKANRLVSITMHKRKASNMFKMKCEKGNEDDINLHKVLNKIKAEIKQVPTLKNEYLLGDQEALSEMCISTLENLLALASPKFRNSKNIALSSNIASTAFSNHNKVP